MLDIDTKTISTVSAHEAGYIDKDLEEIVGLQTDAPLKRAIMPFGGIRIVEKSCEAYGREVDPETDRIFHTARKTHNDGVFDVYTPDIRAARSSHLITGLPDGYGRGRIIGDYRRVTLYGVDALIAEKKEELEILNVDDFTEKVIREREEISEQIKALKQYSLQHHFGLLLLLNIQSITIEQLLLHLKQVLICHIHILQPLLLMLVMRQFVLSFLLFHE